MSHTITVPDVPAPKDRLCWKQNALMHRCDRRADHLGPHTWEFPTWRDIASDPPDAGTTVLVFYRNEFGKTRRVRAAYFEAGTLDMEDSVFDADVDEEGKNVSAGWYEESDSHEPYYMPLSGTPLRWCALLPPPAEPPKETT